MGVEIEAKLKVDDLSRVREALTHAKATSLGSRLETNTFFDTADKSLLAGDRGLRVRWFEIEGKTTTEVTYKGPRQAGAFKSREEIEFHADDAQAATQMFEKLGFGKTLSFEKRRESFELGDCQIELDTLPHLGTFVEIEGPSESSVQRVREQLALQDATPLTQSYIAMLVEWQEKTGATGDIHL